MMKHELLLRVFCGTSTHIVTIQNTTCQVCTTKHKETKCIQVSSFNRYCQISLTLPVDLCLYMGFLIAWHIGYSRALHGEL